MSMRTYGWVFTLACFSFASFACAARRERPKPAGFVVGTLGPVWEDPERCMQSLQRNPRRNAGVVRVGTWNIKWFPDGQPGSAPSKSGGTDIRWLACAIASLDVDVLGLQEIKLTERGLQAKNELVATLNELTGAVWQLDVDACDDPYRQHVALLHRRDRVTLSNIETHAEVDPTSIHAPRKDPLCPGNLRPGLGAYVTSRNGGVDFHLMVVHLDSGRGDRDFGHRELSWRSFAEVEKKRQALAQDSDMVVLGDFNTMGCKGCAAKNGNEEAQVLEQALSELSPAFSIAPASPSCTHYYKGEGTLLDRIAYTKSMSEAGKIQEVHGVCRATQCARMDLEQTPYFTRLSDHCPSFFDITDKDADN